METLDLSAYGKWISPLLKAAPYSLTYNISVLAVTLC